MKKNYAVKVTDTKVKHERVKNAQPTLIIVNFVHDPKKRKNAACRAKIFYIFDIGFQRIKLEAEAGISTICIVCCFRF